MRKSLLIIATERGYQDGKLLESDDIKEYWHRIQANYMADAVPQVAQYPMVSVAWAAYLGMAIAYCWDIDWETYRTAQYESFYGDQGFDNMDDHIVQDILNIPLSSPEARRLVMTIQTLAQQAIDIIRHEQIQPQSKMAFHVFARACTAMYAIGASIELKQLGYKFEKMTQ